MKKLLCAAAMLAVCLPALATDEPHIQPNATVYISQQSDGFDSDLKAAFIKKHVPLTLTDDKDKADYVVDSKNDIAPAGWAKTIFFSPLPAAHASITLKDNKTGAILYAYSVNKNAARNGLQSTAEACAKHLRETIEKK